MKLSQAISLGILVMATVVLAGCGGKKNSDKLVGKWSLDTDATMKKATESDHNGLMLSTKYPKVNNEVCLASTASRNTGVGVGSNPWTKRGFCNSLPWMSTRGMSSSEGSSCCKAVNKCLAV